MLLLNFIRLVSSFHSKKFPNPDIITKLGILGIRIAQEYSSRFDVIDIEKCIYLSKFQTSDTEKEDRHLLTLLPKKSPLLSQMEYYDNDSYSYSDINYLFKGCLKNGIEITIKAVNENAKKSFTKKVNSLEKELKFFSWFYPKFNKKYKTVEIIENLKKVTEQKLNLNNEIKSTELLKDYLVQYSDYKGFGRLKFPSIYAYLTSDTMLVSKYTYGTYFYQMLENRRLSYKDILEVIKIQLFFILKIGTFHNNLHLGNIILGSDGSIYFQDCNVLSSINDETKLNLFKLLSSVSKYDYSEIPNILNNMSNIKIEAEKMNLVSVEVNNIFKNSKGSYLQKDSIVKNIMYSFKSGINNGMTFNNEIYPVIKSLIYLENMALKVKPKTYFAEDISKILTEISLYQ
ncbi:AarF/UbiB family protein [Fusobacterium sp.]|uniref:AarF/UbiB family protein n=1 Tax=Fusobacterium sp. TaxID=68766 RepID=UPI0029051E1D|nr:AarF/UbiB family protein [Fusobacterium sp.]MDU1910404.1 AarF/UbiB family protein [Fusobacterium sp.]